MTTIRKTLIPVNKNMLPVPAGFMPGFAEGFAAGLSGEKPPYSKVFFTGFKEGFIAGENAYSRLPICILAAEEIWAMEGEALRKMYGIIRKKVVV